MHLRAQGSFQRVPRVDGAVQIPRCFWFATPNTESFWNVNLDRFPHTPRFRRKPQNLLCMERVFPVHGPIRRALVGMLCPSDQQDRVKRDDSSKDCLPRVNMGKLGDKARAGRPLVATSSFTPTR